MLEYLINAHSMPISCFGVFIIFKNGTSLVGGGVKDFSRLLGSFFYDFSPEFRRGPKIFSQKFRGVLRFFPVHIPIARSLTFKNILNTFLNSEMGYIEIKK